MKNILLLLMSIFLLVFSNSCTKEPAASQSRSMIDSVGFATQKWQMDSVMKRINEDYVTELKNIEGFYDTSVMWKMAISPHDDYSYANYLYPAVFRNIKADHIFMVGVFHKAKLFDIDNHVIFGKYDYWSGPYGKTRISAYRNKLLETLPDSILVVKDTIMAVEHSLEALLPFIQYYNKDAQIIPLLVPYMTIENMDQYSKILADQIHQIAEENNWEWGKDYAIVISNDAVHYGDQDWGGSNFASYGTDIEGYRKAIDHERMIIDSCLTGNLDQSKIKKFVDYTVAKDDYKEYKWTWCGRYSIPFGLSMAYHLNNNYSGAKPLQGNFIAYANSIDHPHLKVDDLQMGTTAPANNNHWVGYTTIGYR